MTESDLYRQVQDSYIQMQRRYADCKLLTLQRCSSAVDLDRDATLHGFEDLSDMETWVIDIELSVERVKRALRFDGWSITGDRYVIGMGWREVADRRRIAEPLARRLAKAWVASMFIDHVEHGIPVDYGKAA